MAFITFVACYVPMCFVIGVACAAISASAWPFVVPILLSFDAFGDFETIFDPVLLSIIIDLSNAMVLCFIYQRKGKVAWHPATVRTRARSPSARRPPAPASGSLNDRRGVWTLAGARPDRGDPSGRAGVPRAGGAAQIPRHHQEAFGLGPVRLRDDLHHQGLQAASRCARRQTAGCSTRTGTACLLWRRSGCASRRSCSSTAACTRCAAPMRSRGSRPRPPPPFTAASHRRRLPTGPRRLLPPRRTLEGRPVIGAASMRT